MTKKTTKITQVRINPELSKRIDDLRIRSSFKVSRNSFVEFLLNDSVTSAERGDLIKSQRICDLADNSDSPFKK